MQIDFHYYTIKVLSRYAGFSNKEAQLIAYASQYVDDATEHTKLFFSHKLATNYDRYDPVDYSFDPICTAHKGLNYVKGIGTRPQLDIYIPFHFLPAQQYLCQPQYSYQTKADSIFARELLNWASLPLRAEKDKRSLIKLGIALHTYADTWAHENFSGKYCHKVNNIESIKLYNGTSWNDTPPLKKMLSHLFPDIGHAEAFTLPDQSHLTWKYSSAHGTVERNNTERYLAAAQSIFLYLTSFFNNSTADKWPIVHKKLAACFSVPTNNLDEKKELFEQQFPEIRFTYKPKKWKRLALKKEAYNWSTETEYFPKSRYTALEDNRWFLFHEEAYKQRMYVQTRIKLF